MVSHLYYKVFMYSYVHNIELWDRYVYNSVRALLPSFCSDYFKFDTLYAYINKYINIIAKIMDSVE